MQKVRATIKIIPAEARRLVTTRAMTTVRTQKTTRIVQMTKPAKTQKTISLLSRKPKAENLKRKTVRAKEAISKSV
jgi:hypothetical protein